MCSTYFGFRFVLVSGKLSLPSQYGLCPKRFPLYLTYTLRLQNTLHVYRRHFVSNLTRILYAYLTKKRFVLTFVQSWPAPATNNNQLINDS